MDIERDGNLIEAALWFVLGAGLLIYAWLREPHLRPTLRILAITILCFGGSDLVEARTGAWWKPWWLFVWKAACVLVMTACIVRYYRLTKQPAAFKSEQK